MAGRSAGYGLVCEGAVCRDTEHVEIVGHRQPLGVAEIAEFLSTDWATTERIEEEHDSIGVDEFVKCIPLDFNAF